MSAREELLRKITEEIKKYNDLILNPDAIKDITYDVLYVVEEFARDHQTPKSDKSQLTVGDYVQVHPWLECGDGSATDNLFGIEKKMEDEIRKADGYGYVAPPGCFEGVGIRIVLLGPSGPVPSGFDNGWNFHIDDVEVPD